MSGPSQTQVVNRQARPVAQSRAYDHLYDPVYNVSSGRDHNRNVMTSVYSRTARVPNAQYMFSDLNHFPRAHMEVKRDDPVPQGIPRDFNTKVAYYNAKTVSDFEGCDQRGTDMAKFNGRPNVSFLRSQRADIKLDNSAVDPLIAAHRAHLAAQLELKNQPRTRTVGTQSMYRESETQTDPFTPEYVVRPGSAPEVLRLATLSYGQGLPAGLNEVIMIERARAKRDWEKTLSEVIDEDTKAERVCMMEEQDAMEWKWREEEIEEIQSARLQKLEEYFVERDDENVNKVNAKLESILAKQEQRKASRDFKRQREGLKVLRRLVQKRANPEKKLMRRNIIDDYSDPGSEVFAKTAREGTFTVDDDANRNVVTSDYIDTYRGLLELESWLPESITTPRVVAPPKRPRPTGVKQHNRDRYRNKLESLAMQIKVDKGAPQEEQPLRFLERIPTPPKRPPVPRVAIPEAGADEREQVYIFVQRLLRGRCEQASMFEGKELRRDLIAEVRTTHALEQDEAKDKAQEGADIKSQREKAAEHENRTNTDAAVVGNVAGGTIGRTLDFLSKELVRLQEERRVHAFAMLAEKQRRIREAEESGKRQREEALRAKQDEIFREIAGVHHTSVQTYLEDILIDSTTTVADEIARTEIREKAAAIDRVAQQLHDDGTDETEMGALAIAADLVSSFLLPEAERVVMRQQVKQKQRRFLVAAHRELLAAEHDAESKVQPRAKSMVDTLMEEDEGGSAAEEAAAATKIQAGFRGHKVRKEAAEQEDAATKIQANFKGHQVRKEREQESQAATKIQAQFRGHQVRKTQGEGPADGAEGGDAAEAEAPADPAAGEAATDGPAEASAATQDDPTPPPAETADTAAEPPAATEPAEPTAEATAETPAEPTATQDDPTPPPAETADTAAEPPAAEATASDAEPTPAEPDAEAAADAAQPTETDADNTAEAPTPPAAEPPSESAEEAA